MTTMNSTLLELAYTLDPYAAELLAVKILNDPAKFAKTCLVNEQLTPLQHQIDFMELAKQHKKLSVKASRRVGLSTSINWYAVLWSLTRLNSSMIVVTHDPRTAHEQFMSTMESLELIEIPETLVMKTHLAISKLYYLNSVTLLGLSVLNLQTIYAECLLHALL